MFDSLYVKNYRNLKELNINSFGRVNLITGKNNTGKSTLLEAIAIYVSKGDLNLIYRLLKDRGEISNQESPNYTETNIRILSSLFYNRVVGFEPEDAISIRGIDQIFEELVSLRLVKFIDETSVDEQGYKIRKRRFIQNNLDTDEDVKTGFEIKTENKDDIYLLDSNRPFSMIARYREVRGIGFLQFVKAQNITNDTNGDLFDKIALTDKEQHVIDALKIIEPLTERIAFILEDRERRAVIKLSGSQQILPLQSMGDGINRILTMILAMVNAENGYVLIDEFENGLHYSVQEKLWTIIFELSKKLNIQVFATTHSEDCIRGFERVLNSLDSISEGKLIRLDNKNGVIKPVEFDAKELKIANAQDIEIR